MSQAAPGLVLRRALLAWGLGHLALGRRRSGVALLVAEIAGATLVAFLTISLASSTAYLIPFLAGIAFLVAWAWQAVAAYRSAQAAEGHIGPTPPRSPAAAMGWLALPLLAWTAGFWVIAADAATPAAVVDRFMADWTDGRLVDEGWPPQVVAGATGAAEALDELCASGELRATCDAAQAERFRDVRVRILSQDDRRATAVAEAVRFERRESTLLWLFEGTELVPVVIDRLVTLRLRADPVELPLGLDPGARRWRIVGAEGP
ncbi:MAG: hypothetical protein ACRDGV_08435 [Candidatus Limnocylindria bacterium]